MAKRLRVLVVDDEQLALEMIGTVLTTEGVDVLGLRDAREAAALIDKESFDGIFLDLAMPGLSGLDLVKQVRNSPYNATTPIVVITGRGDPADAMKESFGAGAHFFLSKPLDLAKLRRLANSAHGTMLRERRRGRRVSMGVQLACRMGQRQYTGVTSQISEQGLLFSLLFSRETPVRVGDLVHISFLLPVSLKPVEAMGLVMRTDEHHVTCQFQNLSVETLKAVQEFVAMFPDESPAAPQQKSTIAA